MPTKRRFSTRFSNVVRKGFAYGLTLAVSTAALVVLYATQAKPAGDLLPVLGVSVRSTSTGSFTPASLTPAHWAEVRTSQLFQSNAGTTPATANGDVVGYYSDLSTSNLPLTSVTNGSSRPTLQGVGVAPYLSCDGSDDGLQNSAAAAINTYAAGSTSWFAAIRSNSNGNATAVLSQGGAGASDPIYSLLISNSGSATTLSAISRGDGGVTLISVAQALLLTAFDGNDHVIGMIDNGTTMTPYIDGIAGTPFTYTARTGTFTLTKLALCMIMRASASNNWAGRVYGHVIVNRVLNATEIANLSTYLATLYKVPNTSNYVVATGMQVPQATANIPDAQTSRVQTWSHPTCNITGLQRVDLGWYLAAGSTANTAAYTLGGTVEYTAGTFTNFTWSAATSKAIAAGQVVVSDVAAVSIPKNTKFWIRTANLSGAAVATYPVMSLPAASTTLGMDNGNSATNQLTSGTIAATADLNFLAPAALIGTTDCAGSPRSFLIAGDSLTWGQGDTTAASTQGGVGYPAKMLDTAGYPYVKVAAQGNRAQLWVNSNATIQNFLNVVQFTDALSELGVNDLSNGDSVSTLTFNLKRVWSQLGFYGATLRQSTLTPKTTTTDNCVTTGNQTPQASLSLLNTMNAAIRAVPSPLTAIVEAANQAMSAVDSDVWTAPPAATVVDAGPSCVHPTSTKASSMGTALASGL